MKKLLISAAVLASIAPSAAAQGGYADAGFGYFFAKEDGMDLSLGNIVAHGGYEFNDYFAVEGEIGFGVLDDTVSVYGYDVDVKLSSLFGGFVRAQYPVSENFDVFARAGYVQAEIEASISGYDGNASENGFGLGVGGLYQAGDNLYFRGEYTRYDIKDLEADALMFSVGIKFGQSK